MFTFNFGCQEFILFYLKKNFSLPTVPSNVNADIAFKN